MARRQPPATPQVPPKTLSALAGMDDYDRTLSLDRISRELNISTDEILRQLQVWQQGGYAQPDLEAADALIGGQIPDSSEPTQQPQQGPQFIPDAERYRVKYDPSQEGRTKQDQVEQAIMCESCGAPLGIPSARPIKVNCPNCGQEMTFFR